MPGLPRISFVQATTPRSETVASHLRRRVPSFAARPTSALSLTLSQRERGSGAPRRVRAALTPSPSPSGRGGQAGGEVPACAGTTGAGGAPIQGTHKGCPYTRRHTPAPPRAARCAAPWIPAFAGMTEGAGMTVVGITGAGGEVPAFAGTTGAGGDTPILTFPCRGGRGQAGGEVPACAGTTGTGGAR